LDEPRDENQENPVSTRTKSLGVAAAFAALIVAVPTTFQAYAEPTPSPSPAPAAESSPAAPAPAAESSPAAPAPAAESSPAAPAPASTTVPVPTSTKVPDPQGPGCDAYRKANPAGSPGSIESMALQTGSQALASNPELSTFSDAISGKLNPAINIVNVLDGGPYIVFAPTNAAFAKLDAATLDTLKTDPVVLLPTLFYHMVLGYLGPNDVQGKMPTQDGRSVTVTGKGGEIKVNDVPVTCAFATRGAYIYMIDEVLTPPTPAAEAGEATTTTTTPTTTASPTTTAAPTTTASPTASPTTTAASPAEQTATPATTPSAAATPTTTTAAA
jgi:uncharacterized surface protein with fasciclin (FAS1) repeats